MQIQNIIVKQHVNLEFNLRLLKNLDNLEFNLRLLQNLDT